jgi:hypothetical protein
MEPVMVPPAASQLVADDTMIGGCGAAAALAIWAMDATSASMAAQANFIIILLIGNPLAEHERKY